MTSWYRPDWKIPENVVAYHTIRRGGFSTGIYKGLNVGLHVGDDAGTVLKNRRLLPFHERIHWLDQVHGNSVLSLPCHEVSADAAISSSRNAFCAVMTADCVPVLFCDWQGKEVAAVHAGWKGLATDILAETAARMASSPSAITAWIGPAICGEHYEVPRDIAATFNAFPDVAKASSLPNKFLLNLPDIARHQLEAIGISNITMSQQCTYCEPETFYSHRYATHQGLTSTGRFVSVIGLR